MIMKKNQEGFTLVELLVATFIFVVGMLTLGLMNTIEDLINLSYNDSALDHGNHELPSPDQYTKQYTISYDVSDDTPIALTKTLGIQITWHDGDDQKSIFLQNVKGRIY